MLAQARARLVWPLLAALVLLTRLSHLDIVWVEEGYPTAAAIQMLVLRVGSLPPVSTALSG